MTRIQNRKQNTDFLNSCDLHDSSSSPKWHECVKLDIGIDHAEFQRACLRNAKEYTTSELSHGRKNAFFIFCTLMLMLLEAPCS